MTRGKAIAGVVGAVIAVMLGSGTLAAAAPPVQVDGRVPCPGGDFTRCDTSGLSDPRVRGVETLDIRYQFSSADTGVTWGTDRNVTAAGAWEGTWAGVMYSGPVNDISAWLRGSGA